MGGDFQVNPMERSREEGASAMKRFMQRKMISFVVLGILLTLGLSRASAQQFFNFTGKVVAIHRGTLSVQGDKGETMIFAVGRRTVYVPSRLPAVGERVKVTYFLRRGQNIGSQVEILPAPPKPAKK